MGSSMTALSAYFDACRRKRNMVDYDMANVTTETEVEELIREANNFQQLAETWIAANYLHLKPPAP